MNVLKNIFRFLTALLCASIPAKADLWGGKSHDNFEITYELIQDVELKTYSIFKNSRYEVVVTNTTFGDFMLCQLLDAEGEVITQQYANSQSVVTRLHFQTEMPVEEAKCAYTNVVEIDRSPS